MAEERSITIAFERMPGRRTVNGVDDHLKMLFTNLLTNAVTYSHRGGDVTVSCTASAGGHALVALEDHGIGIPSQKLSRIFEEYYRTEEAVTHCPESTGLGLAIVRHVTEDYRIQVTPWLQITPDLQYITNPGALSSNDDAFVIGLRARFTF